MNWQELLSNLNNDFFTLKDNTSIASMVEGGLIDAEAAKKQWLGAPAATEQQISDKEAELGTILPPSYKAFLLTSNGFQAISPLAGKLYGVQQLQWVKDTEDAGWARQEEYYMSQELSDEEYLVYGEEQRSEWYRAEYFQHSLKIADWYDGCCIFLNPLIKHGEEWEVLEYATWFPGTQRYRSFGEFMEQTHVSNLNLLHDK